MKIELRKISTIKPYPGNPRQNDGAVAAIAASLNEFGFRQPIVVDEAGVIIVGYTCWKSSQRLRVKQCRCMSIASGQMRKHALQRI